MVNGNATGVILIVPTVNANDVADTVGINIISGLTYAKPLHPVLMYCNVTSVASQLMYARNKSS